MKVEGQSSSGASAREARAAPGLVSHTTKGTGPERIEICRDGNRVRRLRRGVGHGARLLAFEASGDAQRYRKTFITFTYRDADGWRADHINTFRRRLRQWCERRGFKLRAVWCSELQQRGALHYHMLVWVPRRFMLPKPDKAGWWPHGSTNIKEAQHAVSYIAKYASKTTADVAAKYPRGARMYGVIGLDPESRRHVRYWQSPTWVRDALTGRADIRKVVGGYCNKFTGEFLASPWRVYVQGDGRVFAVRVSESIH